MAERIWRIVVRLVGGMHGYGWSPLCVCIHDRGMFVAWRQVMKWEGLWFPPLPPGGQSNG